MSSSPPSSNPPVGAAAQNAATSAQNSFPNNPPSATTFCPIPEPGKGGGGSPSDWEAEDVKKGLQSCESGKEIWENGKKANGGKDPTVVKGVPRSGFKAETDISTGTITLSKDLDKCNATQALSFELNNLSSTKEFNKADGDCAAGNLGQEEYTQASEKIEYENAKKALKAFEDCGEKWGCAKGTASRYAWIKPAKDFDDYYKNYLAEEHKNHYRNDWTRNCKANYEKKHPPKKP